MSVNGPSIRRTLAELILHHGVLAGQSQVFSDDPWRIAWESDRRAFVPFLERNSLVLAWRDPVGPAALRAKALATLQSYAHRSGKRVVLIGASASLALDAKHVGFNAVWMGGEQAFDLSSFTLKGKAGSKVRLASNHARTAGGAFRELFPATSTRDRAQIECALNAWRATRPALRNTSFLRGDPFAYPDFRRYFAVETEKVSDSRRCEAAIVCSRVNHTTYYVQDLIRRPDAPRGALELCVSQAFSQLRDDGNYAATLGIVPFFEDARCDKQTLVGSAAEHLIRQFIYPFEGLQQFRSKFPGALTQPVYALYEPGAISLRAIRELISLLT